MDALLQALISGLALGGAYALVALGFSITFTTTKTLNFSHGDFVSAGSFIGMTALALGAGLPFRANLEQLSINIGGQLFALAAAVGLMGLIGIALYLIAVRPFAGKPGMGWVVTTIGFGIMLQSVGLAIWGSAPLRVPGPLGDGVIRVFGVGVRPQELLLIVVAGVVTLLFDWTMRKTMLGKAMRAVAHDRNSASLMGINVNATMLGAFFVSSALAGLSGYLLAPIASASLFLGVGIALKGFSGAMIGGLTKPRGCVVGGFVLGVLESFINLWQAQWREIAVFLVVILVLSVRPNGLFGKAMAEKV